MKILVPLNSAEYLQGFVKAGADEFYIGFFDDNWTKEFGKYSDINRMTGFKKQANRYSFTEIEEIIEKVKSLDKRIYITLNANAYSREEIKFIEETYFNSFINSGVDGIIASDPNLVEALVKANISPIASTMCGIYNSDIAKHYYLMGVKRMILPRDLLLDEIESICTKLPDVTFEAFFMRNGCAFSDGYCLGLHGECGSTCEFIRNHKKRILTTYREFKDINSFDVNDYLYNRAFHRYACGMCALFRMNSIGVNSLKIVGRADMYEGICEDIRLAKENLDILSECESENEYLKKMKFPFNAHIQCMEGLSCYYPEVRF